MPDEENAILFRSVKKCQIWEGTSIFENLCFTFNKNIFAVNDKANNNNLDTPSNEILWSVSTQDFVLDFLAKQYQEP